MSKYTKIRAELDGNVPLYGTMSDQEAADELNTVTKSSNSSLEKMFLFLLNNKNRTNQAGDTVGTAMLGRLRQVAESAEGSDPFGAGITPTDYTITLKGKHAAQSFLDLLTSQHVTELDFESVDLPYDDCTDMGVWKAGNVATLKALSMNQTTTGNLIGAGYVLSEDVRIARAH